MKIAVNTRLLLKEKLEGIGWFTYETLKRIVTAHPEHIFYFIFDRDYSEEFVFAENVQPVITFPPARHPYLWYLYFEHAIPYVLRKLQPDLFLSPDGALSLRTDIPQISVIHDINFVHNKEYLKPVVYKYYNKYFPLFAQKATRIATVSNFSKQDICHHFHIPEEKIDVVYNGSNPVFQPLNAEAKREARVRYAYGYDYFLFVSAIHKRKNLANILRAFELFKEKTSSDYRFIVVGERAGEQGDIDDVLKNMKHKDDVRFLGHLKMNELAQVMGAAQCLVYASLFEGFGIPIVEAFQAETAVITSNVTSMPEIAGDAAWIVNPLSVEEIAEAMRQAATDEALRQKYIAQGRIQRTRFSWDLSAEKLWNCIEKGMER